MLEKRAGAACIYKAMVLEHISTSNTVLEHTSEVLGVFLNSARNITSSGFRKINLYHSSFWPDSVHEWCRQTIWLLNVVEEKACVLHEYRIVLHCKYRPSLSILRHEKFSKKIFRAVEAERFRIL